MGELETPAGGAGRSDSCCSDFNCSGCSLGLDADAGVLAGMVPGFSALAGSNAVSRRLDGVCLMAGTASDEPCGIFHAGNC